MRAASGPCAAKACGLSLRSTSRWYEFVGFGEPRGQTSDVGDLELPVAIGEGDEIVLGGPET